jgi:hypothetical protein
MDSKTREVIRQRAARIAALMQHPAWPEWVDEARRKIDKLEARAAVSALSYEGANQRELDYIRGWIAALRWTYKMPEAAQDQLTRFIEEEARDAERDGSAADRG